MKRLRTLRTDRKVDIIYNKIDVRMNTPATPETLEVQRQTYTCIAASCFSPEEASLLRFFEGHRDRWQRQAGSAWAAAEAIQVLVLRQGA